MGLMNMLFRGQRMMRDTQYAAENPNAMAQRAKHGFLSRLFSRLGVWR